MIGHISRMHIWTLFISRMLSWILYLKTASKEIG